MGAIFNTVRTDGLVIRTAWDELHVGPTELLVTLDHTVRPEGKGITERAIHRMSLQAMCPESLKVLGSLRAVGDWLKEHQPSFRGRPEDPSSFFAHVALFFCLAIQEGLKGVTNVLANYACVRPSKARLWVETARRLGMLTANNIGCQVGRAHGVLTDKAREILASQSVISDAA